MTSKTYFDVMKDKVVITDFQSNMELGPKLHIEVNQNDMTVNALFYRETAIQIRDRLLEIYPLEINTVVEPSSETVYYLLRHPVDNPNKIRACYDGGPEKVYEGIGARERAELHAESQNRTYGDEFVYFVVAREVEQ